MSVRAAVVAVVALLTLAGCGDDPEPAPAAAPVVLRAATLLPGQELPVATGPSLLTVTRAGRAAVAVDRALLGRLAQVRLSSYEPYLKRELSFRGVWLADLLAVVGSGDPASVRITALDDYSVDVTGAALRAGGILVATGDGAGVAIPVADGGPTRIVFAAGTEAGANADQWIWSLRTIEPR